jgi:heme-degrading monooxygenase HmoA
MHARIAYFEGGGPETMEAARRLAEEKFMPQLKEMRGFAGHLQLGQPDSGKAMVITLFTGEEEMRAGDQTLGEMKPPEELGDIRRTGVERCEVVIHDIEHDGKAVRASRLEGSPDRIDESVRFAEESILPQARKLEGNCGVIGFADRSTGTMLILTVWESMEALQQSEEQANRLRQQTAETSGSTIGSVERYEVVTMKVPIGAARR